MSVLILLCILHTYSEFSKLKYKEEAHSHIPSYCIFTSLFLPSCSYVSITGSIGYIGLDPAGFKSQLFHSKFDLGKLLNLTEPPFPHLENGINIFFRELLREANEIIQKIIIYTIMHCSYIILSILFVNLELSCQVL